MTKNKKSLLVKLLTCLKSITILTASLVPTAVTADINVLSYERLSVKSDGSFGDGSIGANQSRHFLLDASEAGRYVTFGSDDANLAEVDTNNANDVFLHDRETKETILVSANPETGAAGDRISSGASISGDGRYIVYYSEAQDIVVGSIGLAQILLYDNVTKLTKRIAYDEIASPLALLNPNISTDGRFIIFGSSENNIVANDNNGSRDVFLYDTQNDAYQLVSSNSSGVQGDAASLAGKVSASGEYVAFVSFANNFAASNGNGFAQVYLKNIETSEVVRVSETLTNGIGNADSGSSILFEKSISLSLSDDGRHIAYGSEASNLVASDTNGKSDVFVFDRVTGLTERVSVYSLTGAEGTALAGAPSISNDGQKIIFATIGASPLEAADVGRPNVVYIHDRVSSQTKLINPSGSLFEFESMPTISPDGTVAIFWSLDSDLVSPPFTSASLNVYAAVLDEPAVIGSTLTVVPESTQINTANTSSTNVDLLLNAQELFAIEVSCTTSNDNITLNSRTAGPVFPATPSSLLIDTTNLGANVFAQATSMSSTINDDGVFVPALPLTANDIYASLVYSVQPVSGMTDITCTALGSDADGLPQTISVTNATIILDNGINPKDPADGQVVTGTVLIPLGVDPADVVVRLTIGDVSVTTIVDANGFFSFDNIKMTDVVISVESTRTVAECSGLTVGNEVASTGDIQLYRGDVDRDGIISMADFTIVSSRFGLSEGERRYRAKADFNKDGIINVQDLAILGSAYGLTACDPAAD